VVLFTSGTAAEPKGVELTYQNLFSNCDDCIFTARMTPDHRFLNCLPPFHVFGLTANVLAPVVLGSSVFCVARFHPMKVAKLLKDERISIFMAIPSMHAALLRLKSAPPDMLRSIHIVASGGEPLPTVVAAGYRERFGVELMQGYGLTETSPVCTLDIPHAHKPGSIGRPIRNVSIRIIDACGADAPLGADGEIWVKGPNVMKGYLDRPEETRGVMTPDGWFRTGDCGQVDADGFVTITGRLKEMMIVGGENVFPREIEAVLLQHPAVADAAVIGAPDESRGEVPIAFVTLKDGATVTDTELRQFARERLAGFKVPRQVRIEEELPRNPIGKILKRKLVDRL
jgi:long-chain acyl-CoA synthetase